MEKYQGWSVAVCLLLVVGAALSESFLKVTWSPGLLALIGVPIGAMFAGSAAERIKKGSEARATRELTKERQDEEGGGEP